MSNTEQLVYTFGIWVIGILFGFIVYHSYWPQPTKEVFIESEVVAQVGIDDAYIEKVNAFLNQEETNRREEILWIARALYTESDRREEKAIIAWVIRNRYEMKYRGQDTYRDIVLDYKQFSAFNHRSMRNYYATVGRYRLPGDVERWQNAVKIAEYVIDAPMEMSPITPNTTHFYAPVGMRGCTPIQYQQNGCRPYWANESNRVYVPVDERRLRVFQNTS